MLAVGKLAIAIALAVCTAGCLVENEHSIVDKPAAPDKRLVGVWALESDGGAQILVLYARDEEPDRLVSSFVIAPRDDAAMTSRAAVRFTEIGGRSYFEATWRTGEWLPVDPPVRRTFGTYELSGDTLKLCLADPETFTPVLKSGALAGFSGIGDSYERRTVVSNDTASLRSYLAKNHFNCTVARTFRRLEGPVQQR
jgi:hypothetical protein